jgi:hypothetical protein
MTKLPDLLYRNFKKAYETHEKTQNFFFSHAKTPRTQRGFALGIFIFLSELSGFA